MDLCEKLRFFVVVIVMTTSIVMTAKPPNSPAFSPRSLSRSMGHSSWNSSRSFSISLDDLMPSKGVLSSLDPVILNGFCKVIETIAEVQTSVIKAEYTRQFLVGACHIAKQAVMVIGDPAGMPKCSSLVTNGICEGLCQEDSDCKVSNAFCAANGYCYVPVTDSKCEDPALIPVKSDNGGQYCEKLCTVDSFCPPGAGCLEDEITKEISCTAPCHSDSDCPNQNGALKCGQNGFCV